jgi:hypothetical protein
MKKKIYLFATILTATAVLFLSSCLKDNAHYINFNTGTTFVDFPLGGFVNYSTDAITETPDTDANGTIVRQFAVNVASANLPTKPTVVKLAVGDQADLDAINKLQTNVTYVMMPSNAYSFTTTTVTIPAGQQYVTTSVTFYKNLLDPSQSYVLPIKIVSGTGAQLTANLNIHYFHFIGNDFAGAYTWDYYRYNAATVLPTPSGGTALGQAGTAVPVSPTEFTVITGYNGQGVRYDVNFTRTVVSGVPMYSNFTVAFVPSDVTGIWAPSTISVLGGPNFYSVHTSNNAPLFDPAGPLTKAQAEQIFCFQYLAYNGSADRYIIDDYHH